jgi:hypothetical protein
MTDQPRTGMAELARELVRRMDRDPAYVQGVLTELVNRAETAEARVVASEAEAQRLSTELRNALSEDLNPDALWRQVDRQWSKRWGGDQRAWERERDELRAENAELRRVVHAMAYEVGEFCHANNGRDTDGYMVVCGLPIDHAGDCSFIKAAT